jgi:hypothetical protein
MVELDKKGEAFIFEKLNSDVLTGTDYSTGNILGGGRFGVFRFRRGARLPAKTRSAFLRGHTLEIFRNELVGESKISKYAMTNPLGRKHEIQIQNPNDKRNLKHKHGGIRGAHRGGWVL